MAIFINQENISAEPIRYIHHWYKQSAGLIEQKILRKSKTIKRSLNPVWKESFEIEVEYHDKVILDVYDENRMTRDDFLGRAVIDTSTATTSNCHRVIGKKRIKDRPSG